MAKLTLTDISNLNPALSGKFKVGDTFYVDFTPVLMWMDGYRAGKRAAKGRRNGHR